MNWETAVVGRVYRVTSRNLEIAVYAGHRGKFIGIREKFGTRYLAAESAWNLKECGVDVPEGMVLDESNPDLFEWLTVLELSLRRE